MAIIRIRPALIVTLLCLIYALAVVAQKGSPLALVTIGARFKPPDIAYSYSDEGYDGQFVYYIARDPSQAALYLDVPAYRFQRILLPALAMPFADDLLPWALLVINLAALFTGTLLLENLLKQHHINPWYALAYGLALGTLGAARLSLSEPLAYALVLGAVTVIQRQRWREGALLLALAALAKETTLIFAAGYSLYWLAQRAWLKSALFSAAALLPFGLWQGVLYSKLGAFGVGSGGAQATSFELVPFMGLARIVTTDLPPETSLGTRLSVGLVLGVLLLPFVLFPTVWALRCCWREYAQKSGWTVYTYLLFANAAIMLFVPSSTYREPLGILRFIVGLQICVLLYAAEKRRYRALLNSTIWATTLFLIIASDFAG